MFIDLKMIDADVRTNRGAETSAMSFDNTVVPLAMVKRRLERIAKDHLRGRRRALGGENPHFWFYAGGHRYIYCYLYKNACTAFREFIAGTSPFKESAPKIGEKIYFLDEHHPICFEDQIRKTDRFIFVFRDPLLRIASLYKNKFIVGDGAEGIFQSVRDLSGLSPKQLSFADLVEDYISPNINKRRRGLPIIERHFVPQRHALAPTRYFAALDLEDLEQELKRIMPDEEVKRYFKSKLNSTSDYMEYHEDVSRAPAKILSERYEKSGELPSDEALITDDLRARIEALYAVDAEMIRSIRAQR